MCDVDASGNQSDEWIDKWFKPFDPRDEKSDAGEDESGNDAWVDRWFRPFDPRDEGIEAGAEEERQSESGNQGGDRESDGDDEAPG